MRRATGWRLIAAVQTAAEIIAHLRTLRDPRNIEGQRRFGIRTATEQFGVAMPVLRTIARGHRRNHALAQALWTSGVHEGRVLATLVEDPKQITRRQMESWVRDADNWVHTDSLAVLFDRTAFAEEKAHAWSARRA